MQQINANKNMTLDRAFCMPELQILMKEEKALSSGNH